MGQVTINGKHWNDLIDTLSKPKENPPIILSFSTALPFLWRCQSDSNYKALLTSWTDICEGKHEVIMCGLSYFEDEKIFKQLNDKQKELLALLKNMYQAHERLELLPLAGKAGMMLFFCAGVLLLIAGFHQSSVVLGILFLISFALFIGVRPVVEPLVKVNKVNQLGTFFSENTQSLDNLKLNGNITIHDGNVQLNPYNYNFLNYSILAHPYITIQNEHITPQNELGYNN